MLRNGRGTFFLAGGLLLLIACLCLAGYNVWDGGRAAAAADGTMKALSAMIESAPAGTANGLEMPGEARIPDYVLAPDMDMPVAEVDGNGYIGCIEFPALNLTLPVMDSWSYPRLKLAPCRYSGSVYQDDMVIAAHNYAQHFGRLGSLAIGDEVRFTDMDGNVFTYTVAELEQLPPVPSVMLAGEWDLSLFTCTLSGQERMTVRCVRSDGGAYSAS